MSTIQSKTIVFITGAYVSHDCWNDWKPFFENKGYTTHTPPWLKKNGTAAEQRSLHPNRDLAQLTLPQLIDHFAAFIKSLPEKPILIGHSFGGLLTQLLVNRDLAAAGIAIHSVPPMGVLPIEWNFLKANIPSLGFFTDINKTFLMPFKTWQFAFTNGMSLADQQSTYDSLVIPECKRTIRGPLGSAGKIDFKKPHAPLLILAGSQDQCIPGTLNRRNFKRYKDKGSVTDFVLKDRTHFVLGQPTWKEDAEFIAQWIASH